jgi:hypothetical protein
VLRCPLVKNPVVTDQIISSVYISSEASPCALGFVI